MKVRKRFGQNFLQDNNIIRNIVKAINPKPDDVVIEIGPGQGAITELLVKSGCQLEVIEIDRDLIFDLRLKYPDISIVESDVLKIDFKERYKGKRIRVVGNLPYNISTPLLFKLFATADIVHDMHFMLQLEVVERMAASASTSEYGRLSIMTQCYCTAEKLFTVPPTAFFPAPKVMSGIVRLTPHDKLPDDTKVLEGMLIQAFSKRRKTIRNALKGYITAEQLEALSLSPMLRPENLTLENYLSIVEVAKENQA